MPDLSSGIEKQGQYREQPPMSLAAKESVDLCGVSPYAQLPKLDSCVAHSSEKSDVYSFNGAHTALAILDSNPARAAPLLRGLSPVQSPLRTTRFCSH